MCVAVRRSLAYVRVQLGRAAGSARVFFFSSYFLFKFWRSRVQTLPGGEPFTTSSWHGIFHARPWYICSPVATPTNTYMVTLLLGLIITIILL